MKKYLLELTVFVTGGVVMIVEIVGSRILAPYLGTSLFVWTGLIGVIMAALALGYYLGGKLADQSSNNRTFGLVILASAGACGLASILPSLVLPFVTSLLTDLRQGTVASALIVFALPSVLLGMIAPFAIKMRLKELAQSGTTVGQLYAISTVGSIVGTFLAGFLLIPTLSSSAILIAVSVLLLTLAVLNTNLRIVDKRLVVLFMLLYISYWRLSQFTEPNVLLKTDTEYSHVKVVQQPNSGRVKGARLLIINKEQSSAIYPGFTNYIVFPYVKFYLRAFDINPKIERVLVIGGGAYTLPNYLARNYRPIEVEAVEIDPALQGVAESFFELQKPPPFRIIVEDGRTFLNRSCPQGKKYDAIFVDAFTSFYSIPHHLTTREAVSLLGKCISEDGVVITNTISAIEGNGGKFLRAEYFTYKEAFSHVYVFPMGFMASNIVQNVMLVASNKPISNKNLLAVAWPEPITKDVPVLTDNFAPIDSYLSAAILAIK